MRNRVTLFAADQHTDEHEVGLAQMVQGACTPVGAGRVQDSFALVRVKRQCYWAVTPEWQFIL